jgi:hypothetical protein
MPIDVDGHNLAEPGYLELLEMYEVRRRVERVAVADAAAQWQSMAVTRTRIIRDLRELIAGLDRRTPQVERAGEAAIARDAAALKARALKRIEMLQLETDSIQSVKHRGRKTRTDDRSNPI